MIQVSGINRAFFALIVTLSLVSISFGEVTVSGDVNPDDPMVWGSWGTVYVGYRDHGTVSIGDGDEVTLNTTWVAYGADSTGEIHFDNGTLATNSLLAGTSQLTGTGTINAKGIVGDVDLVLESAADRTQTLTFNNLPGQNITVNLDIDDNTRLGAGYTGNGTLTIGNGYSVDSSNGYIAQHSGSTGVVTVTGTNTAWNLNTLDVGKHGGNGTLNITDSGEVNVEFVVWGGRNEEIHFDNGTLTTNGLTVGASQVTGTGTINAKGLVSDIDLIFADPNDLVQTINLNSQPGQNVTVNLNATNGGYITGAGHVGQGSLSVSNGVTLSSNFGYIGMHPGSQGVTTVDGDFSTWDLGWNLRVGLQGNGTLNINNGGTVNSCGIGAGSHIGYLTGSSGLIHIDGENSTWTDNRSVFIGYAGQGTLSIADGGRVESGGSEYGLLYHSYIGGGPEEQLFPQPMGTGSVTVEGDGSIWENHGGLFVGYAGQGTLNIFDGGWVGVKDVLTIDFDGDGDSFINMASGGMLALMGWTDGSLNDFLALINGTGSIRYWDSVNSCWSDITNAEFGVDYTLVYQGDYTVLTVNTPVPEPATMGLLAVGGLALLRRRSRWAKTLLRRKKK